MSILTPWRDIPGFGAAGPESMTPADFDQLAKLVHESCGIRLDISKKIMVESRLRKRLRETGSGDFRDYWKYLSQSSTRQEELVNLIDVMTTNKTDFFREPAHFDYLVGRIVEELGPVLKAERRPLNVWSAGCSTGKEPYTLAMALEECRRKNALPDYSILGTDICTDVLAEARRAVYSEAENLDAIAVPLRERYLLKSIERTPATFRVVKQLRDKVRFGRLNFMDPGYGMDNQFDVIFCRNVMIYFDRPTQEAVVTRFSACLRPHGYLFTGHSETLNGLNTPLKNVAPTIYRKT